MKRAVRDAAELRARLGLASSATASHTSLDTAESRFPTFVPLELLGRIRPGDPDDPILRQVLVVPAEDAIEPGFSGDPIGESAAVAADGLLHKYDGRALVIATGACGIHCRYCFRREFPYHEMNARGQDWRPTLAYLQKTPSIDEVLLSGGDPLTLVDEALFELIDRIEAIPHVRRLRIHTRMPVVIPQRVTPPLVRRLQQSRLAAWVVIHCNHARELDEAVFAATDAFLDAGIPVMNQAVLLRGVNDQADALEELCRALVNRRIMPYYLHHLDKVRGAAHFEVPVQRGRELIAAIRSRLPGYAVPQYVIEQAGRSSKTPL